MNTPVKFELAKVLQEKEFDGNYFHYWNMINHSGEWKVDTRIWEYTDNYIEAPTIADVVMWLYEKHGIWITCNKHKDYKPFEFLIHSKNKLNIRGGYNSPIEAYEAAILFCLEKII